MHVPAHAAFGWAIGALAPGSDRRLRGWCLFASIAPDLDGVTYLGGAALYGEWHHVLGHNLLVGVLVVAAAAIHHRGRGAGRIALAALLVAIVFASHLLTDALMTSWHLRMLWPFSHRDFGVDNGFYLSHPVNTALYLASLPAVILLAAWKKVSPLELLSRPLDAAMIDAFRRKTSACATCGSRCSNSCGTCRRPVCLKHGRIRLSAGVVCPACTGP